MSALRSESYRRTTPLDDVAEPAVAAKPPAEIDWNACLARLPELQRTIITLFYFEERSVKEVAMVLDLPEGTVKSHLHRARRALGEMLE